MKITLLVLGKTNDKEIEKLFNGYANRLQHYINFNIEIIPNLKKTKNLSSVEQKKLEGNHILQKINANDFVVLLDENGKHYTSVSFSEFLQKKMNSGIKNLIFVVGGPFGFSEEVYNNAQATLSLSKMTFNHDMVRLFFAEQLYRGFTILKNEPYHNQ